MAKSPKSSRAEPEIAKRRDAGLFNLLKAPPKPHAEIVGKRKPKGKKNPAAK